jgi:hypothetical protein
LLFSACPFFFYRFAIAPADMPLFGKKDVSKKSKKDAEKSQSIEDKYEVKDLLGT